MAKSSKEQIYEDELKVISELKKNGRESIDVIAKKCGCSRQKIWRIINKLEDNKTIWGYASIVNNEKIGMNIYVLLIKKTTSPIDKAVKKIIELTMQRKGLEMGVKIDYSMYLHGEYDWILIFSAKDIKLAKKFSEILTSKYSDVVKDVKLMESLFPVQKEGIVNPELEKLKEYLP